VTLRLPTDNRDRAAVARPADSNLGPVRARPPAAVIAMRRYADAGVAVPAIAEQFGVSRRTVYRYLREDVDYYTVPIDGWVATFAQAEGRAPWRVTPWRRK
jgi:hypothetical protein